MEIPFTQVDQMRKVYSLAVTNFLRPFSEDARKALTEMILGTADEIATKTNWFIGTAPVIKTSIWDVMRHDPKTHAALTKLERITKALMMADGLDVAYIAAIGAMIEQVGLDQDIVDEGYIKTCRPDRHYHINHIPGAAGLLSVILFRDVWGLTAK